MVVTVSGLDKVDERLEALGTSLHDFTDALTGLGKSLILFYSDTVFNSQGQALGQTWPALSPAYDQWKARHFPGRGMLERTGAMRKSFYSDVTPETLFVSNNAPYFTYQQQGTGFSRTSGGTISMLGSLARAHSIGGNGRGRNLPARPMIGVNSRVESLIKAAIQADVKAKIESTNV